MIATCPVLQHKKKIREKLRMHLKLDFECTHTPESLHFIDPSFYPFVFEGVVAFSELDQEPKPVHILWDTGSAQSFILADVLPFSSQSSCDSNVSVQGIELVVLRVPLHTVYLRSDIVTGLVKVAVCTQLPLKRIYLILVNDLAGTKVFCLPEVTEVPCVPEDDVDLRSHTLQQ